MNTKKGKKSSRTYYENAEDETKTIESQGWQITAQERKMLQQQNYCKALENSNIQIYNRGKDE